MPYKGNDVLTCLDGLTPLGSIDRQENQEVNRKGQITIVLSLAVIQTMNLRIRVQAINDTWGERCTKLLFISSRSDIVSPALGFDTPEGLMIY